MITVVNEIAIVPELLRRIDVVLDERPGGPHEMVIVGGGGDGAPAAGGDRQVTPAA